MQKLKTILTISTAVTIAFPAFAFAKDTMPPPSPEQLRQMEATMRTPSPSATSSLRKEARDDESEVSDVGETHRSEVAAQVSALLRAADRDGGIGEDVRQVAHEYASSTERIDAAKDKVEKRSKWKTVLIGSDYKNLGALRSEISTTANQIERLTKARDRATDPSVKADLTAQIDALKATASTTEAFVISNESKFSLLGWFVRIFNR